MGPWLKSNICFEYQILSSILSRSPSEGLFWYPNMADTELKPAEEL